LDASVAIAWCFRDETTPFTERVLNLVSVGANVIVPSIWPLEIANALLWAEQRKRITAALSTAFLQRIRGFSLSIDPVDAGRTFDHVLAIARQLKLSTYDAAYFELALRRSLPLATLDKNLRRAAVASGVGLLR